MSDSDAQRLLELAAREQRRLTRHLLVAAALRASLPSEPIVVGGTAEEYWTSDAYHETDLDLCAPLGRPGRSALETLGFKQDGRHWVREGVAVAVEFPDPAIDGDESRTVLVRVGPGAARIIGPEDLYLDRLRQATLTESRDDVHFHSALAVGVACYERIDWRYVRARIEDARSTEPIVGRALHRLDSLIRRRARRIASEPPSER